MQNVFLMNILNIPLRGIWKDYNHYSAQTDVSVSKMNVANLRIY